MGIHADVSLGQRLDEILFGHATLVGSRLGKYVAYGRNLLVGDMNLVAVHPSLYHGNGLGGAQVEQRPIILGRDQLPCAAYQVQADDLPAVESRLEGTGRRAAGAHRHRPPHHAVFLRLHGAHVADHLGGVAELRRNKLLIE